MRGRLVAMAGLGLGLVLAYVLGNQSLQTGEVTIGTSTGDAASKARSALPQVSLQPRRTVPADPVRGRSGALPSPRGTDADPDPLSALTDGEPDEPAADVGPLLDADDDLMAWALAPAEAPVESAPLLDAEEDLRLATEADDQPPIEVGPPMDADDPDAADTPPDEGAPIEVGPDLDADVEPDDDPVPLADTPRTLATGRSDVSLPP